MDIEAFNFCYINNKTTLEKFRRLALWPSTPNGKSFQCVDGLETFFNSSFALFQ